MVGKAKGSVRGRVKIGENGREGLRVGEGFNLNPPPFSHAYIINPHTRLYFLVGVASEARIEKIGGNIVFLILKEI